MTKSLDKLLCLGVITGAHGVRGGVRIKSFTEYPKHMVAYGPLMNADMSRTFKVNITGKAKAGLLGTIEGVTSREAAEDLKGVELFIARDSLPDLGEDDEFYHADLIGLKVQDETGNDIGKIKAIFDFGSGDILEIAKSKGGTEMLPFTRDTVPHIHMNEGYVTVEFPKEVYATKGREAASETDLADQ